MQPFISGCSTSYLKNLQLIQNNAEKVLTRDRKRHNIYPMLASLHWLLLNPEVNLKSLPSHSGHIHRTTLSQQKLLSGCRPVFKSRIQRKAFSYQARLPSNQLLVWIWNTDTTFTFKIRFKTFFSINHLGLDQMNLNNWYNRFRLLWDLLWHSEHFFSTPLSPLYTSRCLYTTTAWD